MISVAIITRDRNSILPECLESAHRLSDDVVIITNKDHKFKNYANQREFALSKCKHNWVLSLDDDEIISSGLIEEIETVLQKPKFSAYKIPRLNYFWGQPIYHTDWSPENDSHVWLFDKTKAHWQGDVHEEVVVVGPVGLLKNHKIHYAYTSVDHFMTKLNHYTNFEKTVRNPIYEFLRRFVWHQGYKDGWLGFFLSYLMAIYYLVVWVKLWEKRQSS